MANMTSRERRAPPSRQQDLFSEPRLPGLSLFEDLVRHAEEQALIAAIDGFKLSPFRFQGWLGKFSRAYQSAGSNPSISDLASAAGGIGRWSRMSTLSERRKESGRWRRSSVARSASGTPTRLRSLSVLMSPCWRIDGRLSASARW